MHPYKRASQRHTSARLKGISMLESMRNLAKTFLAKVLLALLVVAFGVWGVSGIAGSAFDSALSLTGWGPKDLAQVGSVTINGDEYTKNLQRQIKSISAQSGQSLTMEDARKFGLDKQVLDNMISQAAVGTTARKLKLAVAKQVIDNEIVSTKSFQDTTGKFDQIAFQRALDNAGMTIPGYYAMQTQMHSDAAILDAASGGMPLPAALGTALGQYAGETRDVKYFDVTATEADITKPTDADIDAQYKKTPEAYTAPEYRSAAVLSVDAATLAARQTAAPEEVQAAYDRDKASFATPESRDIVELTFQSLDAAKKARDRIQGGEDIIKVAAEMGFKEDEVSLKGKVKGDFLDPKIAEAAFSTPEGQVSEPVQGKLATALLKPLKVVPAKEPTLEDVKDKVTAAVQHTKAKEQLQKIYEQVEDARGQSMKFEDIAKRAGIALTAVPAVSAVGQDQSGKDVDLPSKPEVLKAIFSSEVGNDNNDALGNGEGYVWYDVRSVIPSALKPLDQVKDQVTKDIVTQRLRVAALDKGKKLAEAIKGGKSIEAVAQENSSTVKTATGLKRNQQSDEFDGAALNAAFSVPEQAATYAPGGDGKSVRVMQVAKVALPAVMATSPELEKLKKQMQTALGNDMQQGLVVALKKSAGVKINDALWKLDTGGEAPPVE